MSAECDRECDDVQGPAHKISPLKIDQLLFSISKDGALKLVEELVGRVWTFVFDATLLIELKVGNKVYSRCAPNMALFSTPSEFLDRIDVICLNDFQESYRVMRVFGEEFSDITLNDFPNRGLSIAWKLLEMSKANPNLDQTVSSQGLLDTECPRCGEYKENCECPECEYCGYKRICCDCERCYDCDELVGDNWDDCVCDECHRCGEYKDNCGKCYMR